MAWDSKFFFLLFPAPLFLGSLLYSPPPGRISGKALLQRAGVDGGLVVHVGCREGGRTAELHGSGAFLVQGLERDPRLVARARARIRSLGLYGKVTIQTWSGPNLPYVDNLVRLLVLEEPGLVSRAELMRVLAPGGVALVKRGGKWEKRVKPIPSEIDEWTHYLHDSTGNPVSHDLMVGPPRRFQWTAAPRWSRHHDRMASMSALVSSGGRIFYIMDMGPRASILLPPKWFLVARDAFSGVFLWKRAIRRWWPHLWPFKSGPIQPARRLVASGNRVYVTLGLDAPLSCLDAATGKTLRIYQGTKATEEILLYGDTLFLLVQDRGREVPDFLPLSRNVGKAKARVAQEFPWDGKERWILALRPESGEILWRRRARVVPLSLAVGSKGVFYHDGEKIRRLDRGSGKEIWRSAPVSLRSSIPVNFGPNLVLYEDLVLFSGGDRRMWGLSAETGKILWEKPHPRSGHNSQEDLLVAGGLVWSGAIATGRDSGTFTGRDPRTGEVRISFPPDVKTYWFHHRCYRSKATDRFILTSRTGVEFIDFRKKHWEINHWVRGGCIYGIMPCNGLLYAPPHDCSCYAQAKVSGFCALAAGKEEEGKEEGGAEGEDRLEKGPAYGFEGGRAGPGVSDWPVFRHDPERSGATPSEVPAKLGRLWATPLGGRLTSPVLAGGRLFTATIEDHTLHALSVRTGKEVWSFTAGGRIDSPPAIHRGLVLFGCADGRLYCLRASDGKSVWTFRAAPRDRRMVSYDQVESVWPLHGSPLVLGDTVYCVAGRSAFLDGGLRLFRLDALTGRVLSKTVIDDLDPRTGANLQVNVRILNMPVALPDILSSDGKFLFMRTQAFRLDGTRLPLPETPPDPARWVAEQGKGHVHLFCPTGFLDGSWFHRGYWVFGSRWSSGAGFYWRAGRYAPAGRILVCDEKRVYGYGRMPQYFQWTTPLNYHLFASKKEIPPAPPPPGRRLAGVVSVPKSPSLDPAGKALTVMVRFRAGSGSGALLARGAGVNGYALVLRKGRLRFVVREARKAYSVGAKRVVTGRWTSAAAVLDRKGRLRIFLDGRPAGKGKAPGPIPSEPAEPMEIGADLRGAVGAWRAPFAFKGLIDEVRIYHRALSPEEIGSWSEGRAGGSPGTEGLVLWYTFDRGKAEDLSGKGNDGRVRGVVPVMGRWGRGLKFPGSGKGRLPFVVRFEWSWKVPLHVRAMVLAGKTLFAAGPPALVDEEKAFDSIGKVETRALLAAQRDAWEGKRGGILIAVSAQDGKGLAQYRLDSPPVWDGMIAAGGKLFLCDLSGRVVCLGGGKE